MEQDVPSPIRTSSCPPDLSPTFPVWSVMHGRYANITKVNLLLTEPSQVSKVGPRKGEQDQPLHLSKTISLFTSKEDPAFAPLTMFAIEPMWLPFFCPNRTPFRSYPCKTVPRWCGFLVAEVYSPFSSVMRCHDAWKIRRLCAVRDWRWKPSTTSTGVALALAPHLARCTPYA